MKIKSEYKIREIAGEAIIVNQGRPGVDLTRIITLNSSARFLYETFASREFEVADVAAALVDNYGIDTALAGTDASKWVESLKNCGIIE